MAAVTAPGRFFEARAASDLLPIYHHVVVTVTGGEVDDPLISGEIPPEGFVETVSVTEALARMTIVVSKENDNQQFLILQPDGTRLSANDPEVRFAGGGSSAKEEIWVIDTPELGVWTLVIAGEGEILVWQDRWPIPAATFTPTAVPSPTMPPSPPTSTPTSTPRPTTTMHPTATRLSPATPPPTVVVPAPSKKIAPVVDQDNALPALWLWGTLAGVLLFSVGGAVYVRERRGNQLVVQGTLHHLQGPRFQDGRNTVTLDSYRRKQLTVGPAGADIPLQAGSVAVTFKATARPGGQVGLTIRSTDGAQMNGRSLVSTHVLQDADILTLGETRLRYENLRLRNARDAHTAPSNRRVAF
jgi:hypothetical protein